MELLQKMLQREGIRPSQYRIKILEFLEKNRVHPTVEIIYEQLKQEFPTVSKTTIYNTLSLFVKRGLITDLTISGNDVRYDIEISPHAHFHCKKCGKIVDLEEVVCPHIRKEIDGNHIETVHLYLKGTCKDCLGR